MEPKVAVIPSVARDLGLLGDSISRRAQSLVATLLGMTEFARPALLRLSRLRPRQCSAKQPHRGVRLGSEDDRR
jgi:hypothetical protein